MHPELKRNRLTSSWPVALLHSSAAALSARERHNRAGKLAALMAATGILVIVLLVPLGSKSKPSGHSGSFAVAKQASRTIAKSNLIDCSYVFSVLGDLLSHDSVAGWQVTSRSSLGGVRQVRAICTEPAMSSARSVAVTWIKERDDWQLKQIDRLP